VDQGLARIQQQLPSVLQQLSRAVTRAPQLIVHRIVHGGSRFTGPVRIDDGTLDELTALVHLAPLHNRLALAVLAQARAILPALPHVAVFDTSFHHALPLEARTYALPPALCERHGIRRFGFHGLSHAHVLRQVSKAVQRPAELLRIVSCHLGNGASLAAIKGGATVDTTMGMTPLEGLVMGSRAGDLDPGVLLELLRVPGMDAARLGDLLNNESGLRGLTGTHDMRQVERRAAAGDQACLLAMSLYCHRVRKYIGAYAAVMGGVDVIAFTAGVGENSARIRRQCLEGLEFLGVTLSEDKNREPRLSNEQPMRDIAAATSAVGLLVILADEESEMALAAAGLWNATRTDSQVP
jgi:acetate kinase